MDQRVQEQLDIIRDIIVKTVPVEQIYLFGSYAYGTPDAESDLDLYVVLNDDTPLRDIDAGIQIRHAIGEKKSLPVDILVAKKSHFATRSTWPTMERKIVREGVRLYG